MIYLAMYKDPDGAPRAFGQAKSKSQAVEIAKAQLATYREKKLKLGDPLSHARYSLHVEEVLEKGDDDAS